MNTRLTRVKLVCAAIGLLVWGYGYRVDDSRLRWAGIVLLAAAALLRFVPKRLRRTDYPET